jgi:hypothetical protein
VFSPIYDSKSPLTSVPEGFKETNAFLIRTFGNPDRLQIGHTGSLIFQKK